MQCINFNNKSLLTLGASTTKQKQTPSKKGGQKSLGFRKGRLFVCLFLFSPLEFGNVTPLWYEDKTRLPYLASLKYGVRWTLLYTAGPRFGRTY